MRNPYAYPGVHQRHLDLEPDVAALGHHRHAAAGQDLHRALQAARLPVGGARSMTTWLLLAGPWILGIVALLYVQLTGQLAFGVVALSLGALLYPLPAFVAER